MARARGDKEYRLPVKGLNTEANILDFPQDYAVDVHNMELDFDPQALRPRKGIVSASTPTFIENRPLSDHDIAVSHFLWENVNNEPTTNFVVVQVGTNLYFISDDGLDDPLTNVHADVVDVTLSLSGTTKGTSALLEPTRINFTSIKGRLLITSEQIDPTLVQYDGTNITTVILSLKIRDLIGINDELEIDEHPTTLSDDHKYNLYNQGWYQQRRLTAGAKTESDPIAEYDTENSHYPSNADIVYLGMVDDTGDLIFDAEYLNDFTFGSSPAAKGHYVVDIFKIDRAAIMANPGESGHAHPVIGR